MRRTGLTALVLLTLLDPAQAGDQRRWFVQVWTEAANPILPDPSPDPGRVQVYIGGEFVACALAPTVKDRWGDILLAPLALGAEARGRRDQIEVRVEGELGRLTRVRTKITEVGGVEVARGGE